MPDLQSSDAVSTKIKDLAQRLRKSAPGLLSKVTAEGQLAKGHIVPELHAAELAGELGLKPNDIDPASLHVQVSFALHRRGVEGKIVAADREPDPDRTMLRALAHAHAWTADQRMGKPLSELAAKTSHSESYTRTVPSSPSFRPRSRKRSSTVASRLY